MLIYVINFAMLAVYSFLNALFKKAFNNKRAVTGVFVFIACAQLIFVLACRDRTIGTDLPGYVNNFVLMSGGGFERYEPAYRLLYRIIGFFTDNPQVMITVVAMLCTVPVGIIVYKYSKMPFLSLALYIALSYYAFNFSGLRQGIAYGLTFLSYKYIRENKFIKFALLIILAALFHESAIFFVAAFFVSKIKVNKISVGVAILAGVVAYIFRWQIVSFVVNIFFTSYIVAETGAGLWLIMCSIIVLLGLVLYPEVKKKLVNTVDQLYMLLITGLVLMVFSSVSNNAMRLANYYYMFVILFIPEVMHAVKSRKLISILAYIVTVACLAMYMHFLRIDDYNIVPYHFFWQ